MEPKVSLDPVEVAKVLAGIMLSPKLAAVIGPYSLILLVAMAGAASALANRPPTSRRGSFIFFAWTTVLSLCFTVPAATLVATYNENWDAQWFFVPMAFSLSYIGDKWKDIFAEGVSMLRAVLRQWANRGSPPPPS